MPIRLITASAGSGKTTKLVSTLLEFLNTYSPPEIVAITFTNAAAAEIKHRVGLPDLNVGTIHSFFAKILREQSVHLDISPDFKIADEIDSEIFFTKLCKDFLLKQIDVEKYHPLFVEFGFTGLWEIMQKLESRFYTISPNLSLSYNDFLLREELAEKERVQVLLKHFSVMDGFRFLNNVCAKKDEDALEKDRKVLCSFYSAIVKFTESGDYRGLVDFLQSVDFDKKPGVKGSKANWGDELLINDVRKRIRDFIDFRRDILEQRLFCGMPEKSAGFEVRLMELFKDIHGLYSEEKRRREILDFNDIEILTHQLVLSSPGICEMYQARYKYILVDEFQDTNRLQKDVLQKLCGNLFLVGDAKQSIYRFRNADVSVFIDTEKKYQDAAEDKLSNNYRSLPAIVDFVNDTFLDLFDNWVEEKKDFDASHQKMFSKKEGTGIVGLFNVGAEDGAVDVEAEARFSVQLILDGISRGRKPADYALLFRTKKYMTVFENELKLAGVKCNLADTDEDLGRSVLRLFTFLQNPFDELSLFEILKYPRFFVDDHSIYKLKKTAKDLWSAISGSEFLEIPEKDILSINRLRAFVKRSYKAKDSERFQVFVSSVLKDSGFIETMMLRHDGDIGEIENLIFDAAVRVDETGGGIFEFLEIMGVARAERKFNPAGDGVKLMSVHASKGLQFPVVILPVLHQSKPIVETLVNNSEGLFSLKLKNDDKISEYNCTALYKTLKEYEYSAECAEAKRLLYVAMTRAMEELYLVSNFIKAGELESAKEELKWNKWIAHIHADKIQTVEVPAIERICARRTNNIRVGETDKNFSVIDSFVPVQRLTVSQIRDAAASPLAEEGVRELSGVERLGVIVHKALELYDAKDLTPYNQYISRLGNDVASHVESIVGSFVRSELGKKIFDDKNIVTVFKEEAYLEKNAGRIIKGRIDRINVYKDKVWVIDFKTGIAEDGDMDGYKAQMDCYLSFARKLFPDKTVYGDVVDVLG